MTQLRSLFVASLATMSLASICVAQTQRTAIPVLDLSPVGNPFVASGSVSVSEEIVDGRLRVSYQEHDITLRNISSKTVLTLVAQLEIQNSYGRGERHVKQYECFFAPDIIKPGDTVTLTEPGPGTTDEPHPADEQRGEPRAELRVLYVQFLDGSVFGHPSFGRDILNIRNITWRVLRRLDLTFTRHGEEEFLEALQEPVDPYAVEVLIENVRQTHKKFGTDAAVRKIRKMLNFAEERQKLIGIGGSPSG